jgi:hypothetical protein
MQNFMRTPHVKFQADKPHLHFYAEPLWLSHVWLPRLLNGGVTSCKQSEGSMMYVIQANGMSLALAPSWRNVSHRYNDCRRRCYGTISQRFSSIRAVG